MTNGAADYIRQNHEEIEERMTTEGNIWKMDSKDVKMGQGSVDLVVTSPPYPMIERWDEYGDYETQHESIKVIFEECYRVLKDGGYMAVNIGDATRSDDEGFKYWPNHAEILVNCMDIGFTPLIPILWFKPTNRANSFLGGGFKPPNVYVTQEHEYILIFRKGGKFDVNEYDEHLWNASEFTKEQRDTWFSQQWDVHGKSQEGFSAFPREISFRLIRMFSCFGDRVFDPFAGTGTTVEMARALGRRGVGYEIDEDAYHEAERKIKRVNHISKRDILKNHILHEESNESCDIFVKNPNPLIDVFDSNE